jgi:hypothetical protein
MPLSRHTMDINNHFEAVVECCEFLQNARLDDDIKKMDVIDSMEMRMYILLRRGVCNSTFPYMGMSDWCINTDVAEST